MKPLVSVVVPVYNAAKYLEECLNSILHQTIRDWECIVVNDGSTDDSLSIIEKFTAQDDRFSCITIPNSGSAKTPRDTGVSNAKSDWIVAIDADDYVDTDTLEKLLDRAKATHADIVYLRMVVFNDTHPGEYVDQYPKADFDMNQILSGVEAVMLTVAAWTIGCNGGLVKRSLWKNLSTFESGIKHINVDEYDTRELLLNAGTVAFVDTAYHYRKYDSSITTKISLKFFGMLITDKMLESLIGNHFGFSSTQMKLMQQQRMSGIIDLQIILFRNWHSLSKLDREKANRQIKENYFDLNKEHVFKDNKLKRLLLTKNYRLFIFVEYCNALRLNFSGK